MAFLLLVEDERLLRWAVRKRLEKAGHAVDEAQSLAEAEAHLSRRRPDLVLLDVNLPDGNGIEFLAAQRERLSESSVIVFTADGRIEDAVRAMKLGAHDFLTKPVDHEELAKRIESALGVLRERLEAEGSRRARERQVRSKLVAESPAMREVLGLAATVAATGTTTVLVQGETGVGKEVIARYIHANSSRANAPLQALNCAAIPENLVESELFGHEKGAFTDAKSTRKGIFELAHGGTVVLDEIGEIPAATQAKLLRVLEERVLRRVGAMREIAVDVRVVALTNRDLARRVETGAFREDLFFRLNVFPITVPPLRERREDIVPLALHFAHQYAAATGKLIQDIEPSLRERLVNHRWSGNVRELRNIVERAVILEEGEILTGTRLYFDHGADAAPETPSPVPEAVMPLEEVELLMVQRALRVTNGNQSQAARLLEVSRDQLRYRVKRFRDLGRLNAEETVER